MKTFVESVNGGIWDATVNDRFVLKSVNRGFWDAIVNDPFVLKFEKMMFSLKNHGPNGLRVKVKELNMIVLPRTSSLPL